jgi:hypothetical protein
MKTSPHYLPGFSHAVLLLALALSTGGCKDQEKCNEALTTARKSMQDDYLDMALARQWREHAGKLCGIGPELTALDSEILAKEEAITKAIADKAAQEAAAGKTAIEAAQGLWKEWDDLDKKEKDKSSLKKTKKATGELVKGLTVAYGTQVQEYNKKQYDKRLDALK